MSTALSADALETLSRYLAEHIGLSYPPSRWSDLERGFLLAAEELGWGNPRQAVAALVSQPLSAQHLNVLANHLTIGETHFFRHAEVYDVLRRIILPAAMRATVQAMRPLRVWSAGCCSGEELYSIGILLAQMGVPLQSEVVSLLGTDLCPNALLKAKRGVYGEWSFRGAPAEVRGTFFTPQTDRTYRLRSDIMGLASFHQLNLAHELWPLSLMGVDALDIVLCRNVLLYFNDDMARSVMRRLASFVRTGGWLVVGPCEVHLAHDIGLEPVSECAVMFRKPELLAPPDFVVEIAEQPPTESHPPPPSDACEQARLLADQGRLEEAEALCREALATVVDDPELHCLLGTILQERGQEEAAILAHRRALQINRDHVMALVSSGLLLQRRGQQREAVENFRRAAAVLRREDPSHATFAGLPPGRLQELLEFVESAGGLP